MIHDNLDPHVSGHIEPAPQRDEEQTMNDREVPITADSTPPIVHAWLDGERVDEAALHAASGYELWSRLKSETDRRRRMNTPTPVSGAIMEAIRKDA
ncbi:MAG: hypothetical protein O2973_01325 [Gemmatimonadetes bacterium]|nr:hypothetical protein [Gemmatimonadota bacterium]